MVVTPIEAGLIGCLVLGCIATILALYSLSRTRKQADFAEKLYQRITRDISIANSGSVGMGQRLLAMEKRLQNNPSNQAQPIDYQQDAEFQPYAQAAELLKMGLSSEEVANRCGLSRAEASLMEMMQKANR
jgi:hypothetical protein